jgi:hypothetical protein
LLFKKKNLPGQKARADTRVYLTWMVVAERAYEKQPHVK